MAERRAGKDPAVRLEYSFDRLLGPKLEQAYRILVPERIRIIGDEPWMKEGSDEGRRSLRQGFLRQTEGGEHDSKPNGGTEGICPRTRVQCS